MDVDVPTSASGACVQPNQSAHPPREHEGDRESYLMTQFREFELACQEFDGGDDPPLAAPTARQQQQTQKVYFSPAKLHEDSRTVSGE